MLDMKRLEYKKFNDSATKIQNVPGGGVKGAQVHIPPRGEDLKTRSSMVVGRVHGGRPYASSLDGSRRIRRGRRRFRTTSDRKKTACDAKSLTDDRLESFMLDDITQAIFMFYQTQAASL